MASMNIDQKIKLASDLKDEGNEFVKQKEFRKALNRYAKIFLWVNGLSGSDQTHSMGAMLGIKQSPNGNPAVTQEQKDAILQLQIAGHSNSALCFIKLGEFEPAVRACNKALEFDSKHPKALYRRSLARQETGDLDGALQDVEAALSLNPNDAGVYRTEMASIKAKLKQRDRKYAEQQAAAFSGAFDRMHIPSSSASATPSTAASSSSS